jgi:hypothetical protein
LIPRILDDLQVVLQLLCSVVCIITYQRGPVLVTQVQISFNIAAGLNMAHRTALCMKQEEGAMAKHRICVTRTALLFSCSFLAPSLSAAHEVRNCPSNAAVPELGSCGVCRSQAHTDRSTQNYRSQFVADANLLLTERVVGTVAMRDGKVFTAVETCILVFRVKRHGVVWKAVRIVR